MEYGLIGEKLGHSYSKLIHEKLADYTYDLCPLSREEFPVFMEQRAFKAINVTIPYKKEVIPYLDELDDNAAAIGAVNTIVNKEGRLIGHNTDFSGFAYMVRESGVEVFGKKALVLGTGGASNAVLAVLKKLGADPVISVSRTGKNGAVTYEACVAEHSDASVIVNTTPVGMFPNMDASPLDLTPFKACEAVLDVIYNPGETKLTAQAKGLGMKGVTGLTMLVAQAKYACELFLETTLDDAVIPVITKEIADQMYGAEEQK
ncbi:MAG: shikimate dehydrogenase [Lachnospiraceae bacterium]